MRWRRAPVASPIGGVHVAETAEAPDAQLAPPPTGPIIVRQSRLLRDGGFALAVVGLGLFIAYFVSKKTVGGITIGVVLSFSLVMAVVLGIRLARNDVRLEVYADRLRYVGRFFPRQAEMRREDGADLLLYRSRRERNSSRFLTLEQLATSLTWSLPYFTRRAVIAACTSLGWRVESRSSWYRPGSVWRATADRLGARTASGVSVTQA